MHVSHMLILCPDILAQMSTLFISELKKKTQYFWIVNCISLDVLGISTIEDIHQHRMSPATTGLLFAAKSGNFIDAIDHVLCKDRLWIKIKAS